MLIEIVCIKVKVIDAQQEFEMHVSDSLSNALIEVRCNLEKEGIYANHHIIIINGKSLSRSNIKPESKINEKDVITFVPVVLGG